MKNKLSNYRYEFGHPMKKCAKAPPYPPSQARKSSQPISDNNTSCSSRIYTFWFRVQGILILVPTSQAIGNYIDLGVKRYKILNLLLKIIHLYHYRADLI